MSTISGFVLGAAVAVGLTVVYGERLQSSLREATALHVPEVAVESASATAPDPVDLQAVIQESETAVVRPPPPPAIVEPPPTVESPQEDIEQLWAGYALRSGELQPRGDFPWRRCFARAAAAYELPESLLLAIARGESNFDPAARSEADAVGLMQILWPQTSRHLGIVREADLYDPCTNVDAGARYLKELAQQFGDNLHLAVAAYNYGPGAIAPGAVPEGARWYSRYIYGHLQRVLGNAQSANAAPRPASVHSGGGSRVLMSFGARHRAQDFMAFLQGEIPELRLELGSSELGQHDVVLRFENDSERETALQSIAATGLLPANTRGNYL